jgi:hypothetical protein
MAERRVNEERLFNAIDALNAKGLVILDKEGNEISLIVNKIDAEGNALGFEVLREAFISTIEKIPNDREKELGSKEDLIPSTFNDIIDDLDDEKKAKAPKKKPPKAAKAKAEGATDQGQAGQTGTGQEPTAKASERSIFGHLLGTQAAAIDVALVEGGGTLKAIAEKVGTNTARVKSHFKHLKDKKNVVITEKEGVYTVVVKVTEETPTEETPTEEAK